MPAHPVSLSLERMPPAEVSMDFIVFFFGTLSMLAHAALACLGVVCGLVVFLAVLAGGIAAMFSTLAGTGQS